MHRIYRLSIQGVRGIARRVEKVGDVRLLVGADMSLHHGQLSLEQALVEEPPARHIYFFVWALVSGHILPNHVGRLIILGMIPMVIEAIDNGQPMAWGTLVLEKLYRELHDIVYHPS